LLVIAGTVQAATFINTCPFVINSPGDYLLSADLICGGGTGITITASDVTLTLEGHRITAGAGENTAAAISASGGQHVRILGPGLITDSLASAFASGVAFSDMHHSEVSGITVSGFNVNGIVAVGGIGTPPSDFLTITANTVGRGSQFGLAGIQLNVVSSTISENDVSGNSVGLAISNAAPASGSPNIVNHNICNGNANGLGLGISGPATVKNNVVNGNPQGGIGVSGPNAEVTNNTSLANGVFDLATGPGCTGTVWSGNTFFNANQSCIH
jgi:hypothetical protein